MQRPQIGASLGVSEEQEQKERCRYSVLSKEVGLGWTGSGQDMEAPSRAWFCSKWTSRVVV